MGRGVKRTIGTGRLDSMNREIKVSGNRGVKAGSGAQSAPPVSPVGDEQISDFWHDRLKETEQFNPVDEIKEINDYIRRGTYKELFDNYGGNKLDAYCLGNDYHSAILKPYGESGPEEYYDLLKEKMNDLDDYKIIDKDTSRGYNRESDIGFNDPIVGLEYNGDDDSMPSMIREHSLEWNLSSGKRILNLKERYVLSTGEGFQKYADTTAGVYEYISDDVHVVKSGSTRTEVIGPNAKNSQYVENNNRTGHVETYHTYVSYGNEEYDNQSYVTSMSWKDDDGNEHEKTFVSKNVSGIYNDSKYYRYTVNGEDSISDERMSEIVDEAYADHRFKVKLEKQYAELSSKIDENGYMDSTMLEYKGKIYPGASKKMVTDLYGREKPAYVSKSGNVVAYLSGAKNAGTYEKNNSKNGIIEKPVKVKAKIVRRMYDYEIVEDRSELEEQHEK